MSLSDDGSSLPPPSPSPPTPPTHKPHCRSKRKKRLTLSTDHTVSFKPKYPKPPTNPSSDSSSQVPRPCTECGKMFWSWKALFGHMRCHPERQWRGINPPPNLQRPQPPQLPPPTPPPEKNKPSPRHTNLSMELFTVEDHEGAAGLLMLANSSGPLRFECTSCKKVFGSRQALGGHRASHKNVKGCFANEEEDYDESSSTMFVLDGRHRCGICFRVFPSGQALGGHMRCHWDKGDPPPPEQLQLQLPSSSYSLVPQVNNVQGSAGLDLNLPPPLPHDSSAITLDLKLGL